ncbi:anti-sigma factor [Marinoscillum sp. MHG1-6]|uniref:anti-sigma factor n=1 Tax=Marinoscillum sp. MHG1-6 TaxID=2959627 RepID=UPI002157C702|nr:anti-sigma factor [Marinoscillum sp. MHG1-6]
MKEQAGKDSVGCSEFQKCLTILHLMLDNEASEEEESYLHNHIEKCMVCFEQYQVEKQIRELLRTRMKKLEVPSDLANNIKTKISQLA